MNVLEFGKNCARLGFACIMFTFGMSLLVIIMVFVFIMVNAILHPVIN